jgi:hypothetical protein
MTPIELRSKVGPDGVLTLTVPIGIAEAGREVKVVVESVPTPMTPEEWRRFIEETAGSITDPTFRRHDQGEYEQRDEWP